MPDTPNDSSQTALDNETLAEGEILKYFLDRYSTPDGPHIESVLSALGACAGFGCQIAIRKKLVETEGVPEEKAFVIVETNDGEKYFFGDSLNRMVLAKIATTLPASVFIYVADGAMEAGAMGNDLPDVDEIAKYSAATVGGGAFGVPRLPEDHQPSELPSVVVRSCWKDVEAIQEKYKIDPMYLGWLPAETAKNVIVSEKDAIAPALAAKIVMEAAIPMSKLNPTASLD